MRLTKQGEYAIRAMLELARQHSKGLIPAKELAAKQEIPSVFLTKILSMLGKAGLIVSQRGSHGGIMLARDPSQITVQSIIEATEGPLRLNICLGEPGECGRKPDCKVHIMWHRAQEAMQKELSITLDQLV